MNESDPIKKIENYAAEEAVRAVDWSRGTAMGDSPIEKVFDIALMAVVKYDYRSPFILVRRPSDWVPQFTEEDQNKIFIQSQVQLGKYRVDFLLHVWNFMGADWEDEKFKYEDRLWRKLIIECDGHEFHERTKEQAAHDRSRDRGLTASGYTVFRFTGSELWRDPVKCATEVIDWCFK